MKRRAIIDPHANFEALCEYKRLSHCELVELNRSQPEIEPLTEQDECDLEEMLLMAGLLEEVFVH
jgi:hypothetical protein